MGWHLLSKNQRCSWRPQSPPAECFFTKSCTFDNTMSVIWWGLGISYLGSGYNQPMASARFLLLRQPLPQNLLLLFPAAESISKLFCSCRHSCQNISKQLTLLSLCPVPTSIKETLSCHKVVSGVVYLCNRMGISPSTWEFKSKSHISQKLFCRLSASKLITYTECMLNMH